VDKAAAGVVVKHNRRFAGTSFDSLPRAVFAVAGVLFYFDALPDTICSREFRLKGIFFSIAFTAVDNFDVALWRRANFRRSGVFDQPGNF
jgi:hypothetical protein